MVYMSTLCIDTQALPSILPLMAPHIGTSVVLAQRAMAFVQYISNDAANRKPLMNVIGMIRFAVSTHGTDALVAERCMHSMRNLAIDTVNKEKVLACLPAALEVRPRAGCLLHPPTSCCGVVQCGIVRSMVQRDAEVVHDHACHIVFLAVSWLVQILEAHAAVPAVVDAVLQLLASLALHVPNKPAMVPSLPLVFDALLRPGTAQATVEKAASVLASLTLCAENKPLLMPRVGELVSARAAFPASALLAEKLLMALRALAVPPLARAPLCAHVPVALSAMAAHPAAVAVQEQVSHLSCFVANPCRTRR